MKPSVRSLLIWAALLAVVVAAIFAPGANPGSAPVEAVAHDARRSAGTAYPAAGGSSAAAPSARSANLPRGTAFPGAGAHANRPSKADPDTVLELKPRDVADLPIGSFSATIGTGPRPAGAPKAAAPPPPPPPAPTAPPPPFHVVGRYVDNGRSTVFMQYNGRTVLATEGMVIDNQYRVDSISNTTIALIYLPLNERQMLPLSGTN